MIFRITVGLLLMLLACSCTQERSKGLQLNKKVDNRHTKPKSGLKIEYGPNLGGFHTDDQGTKHFYVHITATITNDSTIPIHIQSSLSKEYEFPAYCGDSNKYKVFLLPKELTPDTATIYNNIVNGQRDFFNTSLDTPYILSDTLQAHEFCVVTIGVLFPKSTTCDAVPRAVFSHDDKGLYDTCDVQKNSAISGDPRFEIGLKIELYNQRKFIPPEDGCVIIPFGQISYPVH